MGLVLIVLLRSLSNMTASAKLKPLSPVPQTEQQTAVLPAPRKNADTLALVGPSRWAQLVGLLTICALATGFYLKKREIFVPSEGLGYRLGLLGGTMMLLILFYPLVKRSRFFGNGTNAAFWFKWHMMLGVIGPVLIFYHSNFSLGATNSNIALFAMILVGISGIIGRYIYGQIYNGMSGARLDVGGLLAKATRLMAGIESDVGNTSGSLTKALADFSESALPKNAKMLPSLLNAMSLPIKIGFARSRIMAEVRRSVKKNALTQNWSRSEARMHVVQARQHVNEFLNAVSRAAQLTLWERMFSLWHVFHVPLFFLLLVSGVIHVIAVHLY
jgi:hypothetical protein